MKKISIFFFGLLLFVQFLFVGGVWGQSSANYAFTTNATGSLALDANGNAVDMTTGTTQLVAASQDATVSPVTSVGFNYCFMGSFYSQFTASADGILGLGSTAVSGSTVSGGSTTTPRISALGGDFYVSASGKVHYKLVGSAPSRCLVIEWTGMAVTYNTTAANGNSTWQVRLYETTGVVEYVYGAINCSSTTYNPASAGFSINTTANNTASITFSNNSVSNGATFNTNTLALGDVPNLNSTANGSRRVYKFTPPTPASGPSNLTFASVAATTTTLNWTAASPTTGIVRYIVQRSTDGGVTFPVSSNVALGTNTFIATGLSPSTSYTWKVFAVSEGVESTSTATGTQATTAGATYYWVGATGGNWNLPANWNTLANGTGTTRTAVATTDVLIVDGAGTTAGGAMSISVDLASFSIGQLKVTSSTALTLASSATTTRTITLTGGGGDDFIIENGSSLILNNATNAVAFAFSGTGNTGDISGTLTFAGSASNLLTTTGGTGTLVTVTSTGIVNMGFTSISLVGSSTTLVFANGSNCNVTGATTGAYPIPLATWASNSNVTLSGSSTSTTTATNNVQSFGNFVVNLPSLTGTLSFWTTSTTAIIQGNLVITAAGATGGTGIFRALTSGTLTVNGNVNVLQGRLQSASGAGTFNVLGNTTINTNGILDINGGTYNQRGATFTNDGTLTAVAASTRLAFTPLTSIAQTFAGSGNVLTNIGGLSLSNPAGLTITHTNQIITLRVNLFQGTITGSNKITIGTGLALGCITQIGSGGLTTPGGSFDASPTFNLGTGTYGVIYSEESVSRTTGFEIPPTRTVSNITNSNLNGVVLTGGNLSSAALTFSAGCGNFTTSSSDVLTITGTATTAITRTSTTAYVNGPLELTLPSGLASGSTYLFPIGKTALYPFELVNPVTGGTVVVRAEVFDGNCGGTAGNIMATLSTSRYWAASTTSGSSNLTNTNIRLTDAATTGFDAIANSVTVTGAYDIVGGTTSTVTSTTIQTMTPLTSLSGFYVMGSKAAATLATPSITPSGTQCTNVSRAISVLITPGGGAVTSVNLNYSINGTAQTAIAMTNTTNNGGFNADTWTATIPTVTPANGSITWSITATDANSLTRTINGTSYQDAPNTGVTVSATATPSTLCEGSNASLSVSINGGYVNLSEGFEGATYPPTGWTTLNAGTGNNWISSTTAKTGTKAMQYTYNSSNAGDAWIFSTPQQLLVGQTYTVSFWYNTAGSFTEKLKVTAGTAATKADQTNIIWTNSAITNTTYAQATASFTAPSSGVFYFAFNCFSASNQNVLYIDDISISGGIVTNTTAYSWSNGTTSLGTINPLSTPITSGLTYTVTATVNGCPMTSAVTPTVNPLPTAPTATPSSQCGAGIPTASVADNTSYTTPTFKWYSAASGGAVLQSSTSTTYTTSISATTTFYVAVVGTNTCESARTAVTVSVTQPDAISAVTSAATICLGQSVTLTAANTATTPTQNYSYSWECATSGSGATSANTNNPASITPSAAGSYTYTVTGTDGACSAVNTVAVTVNALPNITSATATPSAVCSGAAITLTGASVPASAGIATLGNGTAFGTGTTGTFLRQGNTVGNQFKTQYLFLASELQAAGLTSGNITGLTFDVYASGGGTVSNLTFKLGTTNLTNLTTTYVNGLTQVYNVSTYPATGSVQTGLQSITFNSTYTWDGVSNLVLEACSQLATTGTDGTLRSTTTSFTSTIANNPTTSACSATTGGGTFNERPNFRFNGQIGTNQTSSLTWSWNSTPAIATATGSTTETNTSVSATTKTYTVTATNATTGCVNTATTSAITINPVTVAPSATNSSQCGTATPTCSVTGTGASGNTFKWYLAATGGTALAGQSLATLSNYPISATTSFYVSEFNGTCESARVQVEASVTAAPTITAAASVNPVCNGSATSLTATSANSGYTYSWSNSAGTGATVSVNPTSSTIYTVTGTDNSGGVNNGCSTLGTVSVNVNPIPTNLTANSNSTTICNGTAVNLTSSATSNSSNIVLLSPSGDGGFESGSTFVDNNWLTAVTGNNFWYVGNAVVNSGSRSAYISTTGSAGAAAVYNKGTARVSHLYRDVTFPAGATNITLSFNWQGVGESGWDYTTVYLVPNTVTPTAGVTLSSGQIGGVLNGQSTWQTSINNLNSNLAGTTQRLVFSWINDDSDGVDPAGVIDNVSITYTPPVSYSWSSTPSGFTSTSQNPTGVAPLVNTSYTATATNSFGCSTSASVTVNVVNPSTQTIATNDFVWRGTTSTAWSTASNWVKFDGTTYAVASTLPVATDNVFIPQNNTCVVNQPSIGAGTVTANAVYIEPSATVTGGSGTLDVKGDFTNNGTFTAGTGTVSFSGTTAQQITGATTFYNLTENNSAGLTLNSPVMVSNGLTMTAGNITTSSTNLLTLGNSAPATLAWTNGKVVGPMKRWMAAATNSGVGSSMFPLGNATRNAQVSIEYTTAPTTAGYLEAKFIASTPATAATNAFATLTDQFNYVLDNVVTEGYWEINPSATSGVAGGTYTVTLEGETISLAASTNASYTDVRVIKSPDPHTSWILQGDHGTATGTNADFTVSRTGMSGYSFFAMAFPSAAPLPVELVSFSAICEDNNTVSVNWTTASEHNSDYYTVEKSRDGMNWNILATKAAAGNSTQLINYSVADVADISGTIYYRLTQVDVDGATKVYDIVSTSCTSEKELTLLAYPNPSNGQFTLKIENAAGGMYALEITDMQGKAIEEQSLDLETGTTVVKMNPVGLQPGVYMLQFKQDGQSIQQQKIVIE